MQIGIAPRNRNGIYHVLVDGKAVCGAKNHADRELPLQGDGFYSAPHSLCGRCTARGQGALAVQLMRNEAKLVALANEEADRSSLEIMRLAQPGDQVTVSPRVGLYESRDTEPGLQPWIAEFVDLEVNGKREITGIHVREVRGGETRQLKAPLHASKVGGVSKQRFVIDCK